MRIYTVKLNEFIVKKNDISTNNSKNGSFVNKENNDSANIDEKPKTTINRDYRCSKPPVSATTKREILNKSLGRIDISSTKNFEKNLSSRTPIFKKPQCEGLADKYVNRIKNSFNRTLYPSSINYLKVSTTRQKSLEAIKERKKDSGENINTMINKRALKPTEYPPTYKKIIINTPSPLIIQKKKTNISDNSKSSNERRDSFQSQTSLVRKSVNGSIFQFDDKISISNFRLEGHLGKGAYAVVKMAYQKGNDKKVAIKTYDKYKLSDQHKLNNVRREISILRRLDHSGIASLYHAFEDKRQIHLVMEYVGTVTLGKYLKGKIGRKVCEDDAKIIFRNLTSSIEYCHNLSISHRDIKMDNIMITSSLETKLIDFGFAIVQHPEKKLRIFCGTPSFMSPEIVSKMSYDGLKADIWALGVLLYVLCAGEFPFKALNEKDLFRKICAATPNFSSSFSSTQTELLKKMLRSNPFERLTASDVQFLVISDTKP